jgi:hypothetical protein
VLLPRVHLSGTRPGAAVECAGSHQQTTQDWWENRRNEFECSVSQVVIDEASVGDPTEVQKRLAIIAGLPSLALTDAAKVLTQASWPRASFRGTPFATPHMLPWRPYTRLTICSPGIASTWRTHKSRGE